MSLAYLVGAAVAVLMLKPPQVLKVGGRADFAAKFRDAARFADLRGIPVDFALAVAALETGWGTGRVFHQTNNLFSITAGSSWRGVTYKASTGFVFRVYNSLTESINDFARLIATARIYDNAYEQARRGNADWFFGGLQAAGYAGSDTEYAAKLKRTLEVLA